MNKSARPPLVLKPLSYNGGLSSLQNTPRSLQPPASVHSSAPSSLQPTSHEAHQGDNPMGASEGGCSGGGRDQAIDSDDNDHTEFKIKHHGLGHGQDSMSSLRECVAPHHSPPRSTREGRHTDDGRKENALVAIPKTTSSPSVSQEVAANESHTATSMYQVSNLDTNSTPFWLINGPGHQAAAGGYYYWQEQWRQRQQTGELAT